MKIHWNNGEPYYYIGYRVYACHKGKDKNLYQKKKYAENRDAKACKDHDFTQRRNLAQPTKKLDCPVVIKVTRVLSLPKFKVDKITKWKKDKMAELIRKKVREGENISGENRYCFTLPADDSHKNHVVGLTAAVTESIDPKVRSKIKELVLQGNRNISVILALVEQFVANDLGETNDMRSRFYPPRKCVRNIINNVKKEIRWSKIDVENVERLIKSWRQKSDPSDIYFRPCTLQHNSNDIQQEDSDEESEEEDLTLKWKKTPSNHLLFVYQSKQMKMLFQRYAKDGVLLDATYKTCKWALPLYFVAIKSNVGYQPVAVFITQFETQQAIIEALNIIKEWNKETTPKYGMVDFAMEEILALEAVFPGIKVFICSFHREQAWTRWLSKSHTSSSVPRADALKNLREIANAPSEEKLLEAIENLKKWSCYEDSPLKAYFERTWEPEVKRWALAHKPPGLLYHTNNGLERINEELKYRYLMENKNCSLAEMIDIVVNHFLPDRYKCYVLENVRMVSSHKRYASSIPEFLHNRPKWIVDHVKKLMDLLDGELTDDVFFEKLTNSSFKVGSLTTKNKIYDIIISKNSTCTCEAYSRSKLLCKHICFILKKIPELGKIILQNEVFKMDESVVDVKNSEVNNLTEKDDQNQYEQPAEENYSGSDLLETRKSKKKKDIAECNSIIRSLQSTMWLLDEDYLEKLKTDLRNTLNEASLHVSTDKDTSLPLQTKSSKDSTKNKRHLSEYAKLPKPAKKKIKRFGQAADAKKLQINISS